MIQMYIAYDINCREITYFFSYMLVYMCVCVWHGSRDKQYCNEYIYVMVVLMNMFVVCEVVVLPPISEYIWKPHPVQFCLTQ